MFFKQMKLFLLLSTFLLSFISINIIVIIIFRSILMTFLFAFLAIHNSRSESHLRRHTGLTLTAAKPPPRVAAGRARGRPAAAVPAFRRPNVALARGAVTATRHNTKAAALILGFADCYSGCMV